MPESPIPEKDSKLQINPTSFLPENEENLEDDYIPQNKRTRVYLSIKPSILAYATTYARRLFNGKLSEAVEDMIVRTAGPEYMKCAYDIQRLRKEKKLNEND